MMSENKLNSIPILVFFTLNYGYRPLSWPAVVPLLGDLATQTTILNHILEHQIVEDFCVP